MRIFYFLRKFISFFTLPFLVFFSLTFSQSFRLAVAQTSNSPVWSASLAVPSELGKIEEVFLAGETNTSETIPTIIIQDAHINFDAQMSEAGLFKYFTTKRPYEKILLEGVIESLDTRALKEYPDKKKKEDLSKRWVKKGILKGGEYFDINLNEKDVDFIGLEDAALYNQNFKAFLDLHNIKNKAFESQFKKFKSVLKNLENSLFPKPLKKFLKIRNRYYNGELSFADYLLILKERTDEWKKTKNLKVVLEMSATAPRSVLDEQIKTIDPSELFQEIEKLESVIVEDLTPSLEVESLWRLLREFELLEKGISLELSRPEKEEFERFRGGLTILSLKERFQSFGVSLQISPFVKWNEVLLGILKFYNAAEMREEVFKERILLYPNSIVLVGGYHTAGLAQFLRQRKMPFIIVSPKINRIDSKEDHAIYIQRVLAMKPKDTFVTEYVFRSDMSSEEKKKTAIEAYREMGVSSEAAAALGESVFSVPEMTIGEKREIAIGEAKAVLKASDKDSPEERRRAQAIHAANRILQITGKSLPQKEFATASLGEGDVPVNAKELRGELFGSWFERLEEKARIPEQLKWEIQFMFNSWSDEFAEFGVPVEKRIDMIDSMIRLMMPGLMIDQKTKGMSELAQQAIRKFFIQLYAEKSRSGKILMSDYNIYPRLKLSKQPDLFLKRLADFIEVGSNQFDLVRDKKQHPYHLVYLFLLTHPDVAVSLFDQVEDADSNPEDFWNKLSSSYSRVSSSLGVDDKTQKIPLPGKIQFLRKSFYDANFYEAERADSKVKVVFDLDETLISGSVTGGVPMLRPGIELALERLMSDPLLRDKVKWILWTNANEAYVRQQANALPALNDLIRRFELVITRENVLGLPNDFERTDPSGAVSDFYTKNNRRALPPKNLAVPGYDILIDDNQDTVLQAEELGSQYSVYLVAPWTVNGEAWEDDSKILEAQIRAMVTEAVVQRQILSPSDETRRGSMEPLGRELEPASSLGEESDEKHLIEHLRSIVKDTLSALKLFREEVVYLKEVVEGGGKLNEEDFGNLTAGYEIVESEGTNKLMGLETTHEDDVPGLIDLVLDPVIKIKDLMSTIQRDRNPRRLKKAFQNLLLAVDATEDLFDDFFTLVTIESFEGLVDLKSSKLPFHKKLTKEDLIAIKNATNSEVYPGVSFILQNSRSVYHDLFGGGVDESSPVLAVFPYLMKMAELKHISGTTSLVHVAEIVRYLEYIEKNDYESFVEGLDGGRIDRKTFLEFHKAFKQALEPAGYEISRIKKDGSPKTKEEMIREKEEMKKKNRELSYLYAILHNIGELEEHRLHPYKGAHIARPIMRKLGFITGPFKEDSKRVEWFIRHQLSVADIYLGELHPNDFLSSAAVVPGSSKEKLLKFSGIFTLAEYRVFGNGALITPDRLEFILNFIHNDDLDYVADTFDKYRLLRYASDADGVVDQVKFNHLRREVSELEKLTGRHHANGFEENLRDHIRIIEHSTLLFQAMPADELVKLLYLISQVVERVPVPSSVEIRSVRFTASNHHAALTAPKIAELLKSLSYMDLIKLGRRIESADDAIEELKKIGFTIRFDDTHTEIIFDNLVLLEEQELDGKRDSEGFESEVLEEEKPKKISSMSLEEIQNALLSREYKSEFELFLLSLLMVAKNNIPDSSSYLQAYQKVAELVRDLGDKTILDIGAGREPVLIWTLEDQMGFNPENLYAIDPIMHLGFTNERVIRGRVEDGMPKDWGDKFDFIYSSSVFVDEVMYGTLYPEFVMNIDEAIREVDRVLKPGGTFLLSLPVEAEFDSALKEALAQVFRRIDIGSKSVFYYEKPEIHDVNSTSSSLGDLADSSLSTADRKSYEPRAMSQELKSTLASHNKDLNVVVSIRDKSDLDQMDFGYYERLLALNPKNTLTLYLPASLKGEIPSSLKPFEGKNLLIKARETAKLSEVVQSLRMKYPEIAVVGTNGEVFSAGLSSFEGIRLVSDKAMKDKALKTPERDINAIDYLTTMAFGLLAQDGQLGFDSGLVKSKNNSYYLDFYYLMGELIQKWLGEFKAALQTARAA